MNKEFTLYPEAFELKQLGFDELTFGWYDGEYKDIINYDRTRNSCGWLNDNSCSVPTYSQAFRFFREKHGLHSEIRYVDDVLTYSYLITKIKTNTELEEKFRFTYEEAELACLRKLIEIVKNK